VLTVDEHTEATELADDIRTGLCRRGSRGPWPTPPGLDRERLLAELRTARRVLADQDATAGAWLGAVATVVTVARLHQFAEGTVRPLERLAGTVLARERAGYVVVGRGGMVRAA
jgi:hypothetical protein